MNRSGEDLGGKYSTQGALGQVLDSMRVSGSLLLNEEYAVPWAVSVPDSNELNNLLDTPRRMNIAAFHLVEKGQVQIKLGNGMSVVAEEGDIVICFSGQGHLLYEGVADVVVPVEKIITSEQNPFLSTQCDERSALICGVFIFRETAFNPFIGTLPELAKINTRNKHSSRNLQAVAELLRQEFKSRKLGHHYITERYLEILCAELIQAHQSSLPKHAQGWLAALKDPVIGRAIEAIHSQPDANWSVACLASEVAISPSRFAARFKALLGESPMNYIAKWRVFIASKLLESSRENVGKIANAVGYQSVTAFSRAFKKYTGKTPSKWRAETERQ